MFIETDGLARLRRGLTIVDGCTLPQSLRHLELQDHSFSTLAQVQMPLSLEILIVSGNRLRGALDEAIPMASLARCKMLRAFDVSHNMIDEVRVKLPLSSGLDLQWVDISDNHISGRALVHFSHLISSLVGFYAQNNHIAGTLEDLFSERCKYTYMGDDIRFHRRTLRFLHLSNNSLYGSIPEFFCYCFSPIEHCRHETSTHGHESLFTFHDEHVVPINVGYPQFRACAGSLFLESRYEQDARAAEAIGTSTTQQNFLTGASKCMESTGTGKQIYLAHNNLSGKLPSCMAMTLGDYTMKINIDGKDPATMYTQAQTGAACPQGFTRITNKTDCRAAITLLGGKHEDQYCSSKWAEHCTKLNKGCQKYFAHPGKDASEFANNVYFSSQQFQMPGKDSFFGSSPPSGRLEGKQSVPSLCLNKGGDQMVFEYGHCLWYSFQGWCRNGKAGPKWNAAVWGILSKTSPHAADSCCDCGGGSKTTGQLEANSGSFAEYCRRDGTYA